MIGEKRSGYGSLAWKEMMKYLIKKKIRKITAATMEINKPMIKIFQKSMMTFEYRKEKHFIFDGHPVDMIGYCFFNSEKSIV